MTAAELYPDIVKKDGSLLWAFSDYQPIINSFGKVLIQVDDTDYQGDTRVLYEKDGKYGWLNFGWGSCSGCDALQACSSVEAVNALIVELRDSVKWFDSFDDLQKFFREHDWQGDYSWYQSEQKQFVEKVLSYTP